MHMKTFGRSITLALAFSLGLLAQAASAEPLMTLVGFAESAYDNRASDEIVIKVTRTDQDPSTEDQELTVDLVAAGDAVENEDYRFSLNGTDGKPGRITFAPGVRERLVTIRVIRKPGASKKLQLSLSNPSGPTTAVTGENPTATVTILN
jgi:hypothetical protein